MRELGAHACDLMQAHWRGYHLRKRLQEVLERARYMEDEEGDMEQYIYDEEIRLDCLDEVTLA